MTSIDYGRGVTNINLKTGIRYGVISMNSISGYALDDLVYDYPFSCPNCGNEDLAKSKSTKYDYYCHNCRTWHMEEDCCGEESIGFHYDEDGYKLVDCLDNDIMVIESPFYTFTDFCSPCVPGAGNLNCFDIDGVKTYCLGLDWFDSGDEDRKCPYPVYSVETGILINVEED